ncbi:hypothetical protein AAG570_010350 [Ranatra chinensis]|uniref:Uncharacterized protein n=1 Tax=Ranatra chinensis TaxID=642074 RepID=A0ABD0YM97_9HEMI
MEGVKMVLNGFRYGRGSGWDVKMQMSSANVAICVGMSEVIILWGRKVAYAGYEFRSASSFKRSVESTRDVSTCAALEVVEAMGGGFRGVQVVWDQLLHGRDGGDAAAHCHQRTSRLATSQLPVNTRHACNNSFCFTSYDHFLAVYNPNMELGPE